MSAATVGQVCSFLDACYDPTDAEEWDAVGLVCGEPAAAVERVLFAVDPVAEVAAEAVRGGVQLLVTHHPLYLRGTTSVAASTPKGRVVHELIRHGIALYVAHTNADVARPGVSDALAELLGVRGLTPVQPLPVAPLDKIVTFVPAAEADRVVDAMAAAGAGAIGSYRRCAYTVDGTGTFLPLPGAEPAVGSVGSVAHVAERRVEMVLARHLRAAVVRAMLDAHPYEQPAYDLFEHAAEPSERGLGRIGRLDRDVSLRQFVDTVGQRLPTTAGGVRATGHPDRLVRTVAVCGGSGGELAGAASRLGADVLVTADLRHHPASELSRDHDLALVDVSHWASEWPWLAPAAERLRAGLQADGTTVEPMVSRQVTDPWTMHAGCREG